ncbi:hypothetical protein [Halopseudomonas oceani]|uniref:hypothetical protein n=1 Tax=Halopseudomonas oceani TaxID=1708783 RepID=UPI0011AF98FC|nr:hypothetical protein [Halopseudomonas oceani]
MLALPGGAILLGVTALLRLKPWASLLLFVLTIQAIAIGVELYLFKSTVADISWVYGVVTFPASLLAWRVSAYPAYLQTRGYVDAKKHSKTGLPATGPAALQCAQRGA